MKAQGRWMANIIEESAVCATVLPWERGSRRRDMIERRRAAVARARARVIAIHDRAAQVIA